MEGKKLLMVVNPKAGRSKSHGPLYDAAAALCDQGGYLLSIHNTTAPGDAKAYILRHGTEYGVIVAAGGDGTLHEAVSALMELREEAAREAHGTESGAGRGQAESGAGPSQTPEALPLLGYLPQGSTNDFAASLRISPEPAQAAAAMVRAAPRRLDIGRWNGRYFVYVASFGAFTRSSYTASQSVKNALGHFAYVLEGARSLDTLRPYAIRLTADGEKLDGEYLFGAVCNSTSIGGMMKLEADRVILDDGLFELLLIPNPRTPVELQNLMLALVNQEYDSLIFRHVSSIRLETEEDLPWSLDGEYAPSAPVVEIENRRQALAMLL